MFRTDGYHVVIHSPNKLPDRKARTFPKRKERRGFFSGLNMSIVTAQQTHSDSSGHLKGKAVGLRGARDRFLIDITLLAATGNHNVFIGQVFNAVRAVGNKK